MSGLGPTLPGGRSLLWSCDRQGDGVLIRLEGDIDENAGLMDMEAVLSGEVRLDLGGVRRINSAGVREWVQFIRRACELTTRTTLCKCSPAIVMQMNMIANFRGAAEVESIYAPFVCPRCDLERDVFVPVTAALVAGHSGDVPELTCEECGALLELDDISERYFAFLRRSST